MKNGEKKCVVLEHGLALLTEFSSVSDKKLPILSLYSSSAGELGNMTSPASCTRLGYKDLHTLHLLLRDYYETPGETEAEPRRITTSL